MGVMDTLLRKRKVVKTTVVEEEFEEKEEAVDKQNEQQKQEIKNVLSDLHVRVRALELDIQNIRGTEW